MSKNPFENILKHLPLGSKARKMALVGGIAACGAACVALGPVALGNVSILTLAAWMGGRKEENGTMKNWFQEFLKQAENKKKAQIWTEQQDRQRRFAMQQKEP